MLRVDLAVKYPMWIPQIRFTAGTGLTYIGARQPSFPGRSQLGNQSLFDIFHTCRKVPDTIKCNRTWLGEAEPNLRKIEGCRGVHFGCVE